MKVRDSDLKEIELALRAPVGATEGKRGRGNVSRALEKLLPAIDARRAAGASHTEIIEFLIQRGVVKSAASYWTGIRIARRNFLERVTREKTALAKDGGWTRDARASGAAAPAPAPATPVKPGLENLSPDQIQELALAQLAQQRFHDKIDAELEGNVEPVLAANLRTGGNLRPIGKETAQAGKSRRPRNPANMTTRELIAENAAMVEAAHDWSKPAGISPGLKAIVDRQLQREQAEREAAAESEQKPEAES